MLGKVYIKRKEKYEYGVTGNVIIAPPPVLLIIIP